MTTAPVSTHPWLTTSCLAAALLAAAGCGPSDQKQARQCLDRHGLTEGDVVELRLTDCRDFTGESARWRVDGATYKRNTTSDCSGFFGCTNRKQRFVEVDWTKVGGHEEFEMSENTLMCEGSESVPGSPGVNMARNNPETDWPGDWVTCRGDPGAVDCDYRKDPNSGPNACEGTLSVVDSE